MEFVYHFLQKNASLAVKALSCAALMALAACSGEAEEEDFSAKNESVPVLYARAHTELKAQQYQKAIESFEEVERQHPYSEWAPRAELMAAYAGYKGGKFEDSIMILDRFVKLHPTHPRTPYAYYLKALCYYIQITDVGRDQKMTEDAREALREVVDRYPDSDYAKDAKLKLDLTDDHLAGKEMEIGRYYLTHDEYLAAINRFTFVLDHYQTTSHTPETLHRLVEAYLRLGLVEEAKKYAAVLGHNFPASPWYRYSYEMLKGNLSPEEQKTFLERFAL